MWSAEGRVRLFLAFLILVLVLVNSQSLQVASQSRGLVAELFESVAREASLRVAAEVGRHADESASLLGSRLAGIAAERGYLSACLMDWSGRLVTGGDCPPTRGEALDRLDEDGKRRLTETGWALSAVTPPYDAAAARGFGYLALGEPLGPAMAGRILRVEFRAPEIADTNRKFRATLIYQVSALSLVLLALVLFLNSLLAPHRRLVAEAQSVASELQDTVPAGGNEEEFLLQTFQDVVARLKEKERELSGLHQLEKARADETEALASDIIRSMTTGLVSLDSSRAVVLVNPAAEAIFGVRADEARGRSFPEVFEGSPELSELVSEALEKGTYRRRGRALYELEGGQVLHLGVSVIPLRGASSEVRGALCLLADLTEVVELRERLFLKDNLARLGEMAAGIAHEFRNGLATIQGNAKLLEDKTTPDAREIVLALVEETHSLSRVVTEFLQFARPEPLRVEPVDLVALAGEIREELAPVAEAAGATVTVTGADVTLEGDDVLLRKALTNLVSNAVESLEEAGVRGGRVEVDVTRTDGEALVRVRDDGPGVPAEMRGRIFTPFFTGKATGTGLGLSVVQKIAVTHSGSIELEDTDSGASFLLRLPLARPAETEPDAWV